MTMTLRQVMQSIRGDISALMLIAFVFQLLMPVIVFAGERDSLSEFERQMQQSICRIQLDYGNDEPQSTQHTDGFVCDLCVLCHHIALPDQSVELVFIALGIRYQVRLKPSPVAHDQTFGTRHPARAPPLA